MQLAFRYRRYRLPFRTAVRTAHGLWPEREGVLVRLENRAGKVAFGEAAPIPWFGTETIDHVEQRARDLGKTIELEEGTAAEIASSSACLANALTSAWADLAPTAPAATDSGGPQRVSGQHVVGTTRAATDYLTVAAMLPAGPAARERVAALADVGFRVFKWKVGVLAPAEELPLLDDLCADLPEGAKLRLDANGAWDRRQAEQWLARCADRPVEFVEQPCFAPASAGREQRERIEDLLRGLAEDFPTPIALDESLVGDGDIDHWLAVGWRGLWVVKASLLANPLGSLARLRSANATVIFSSALETAIGARAALRLAFDWTGSRRALGFGVWPLFADPRCDGPRATPFLHRSDVEQLDASRVWDAVAPHA